MENKNYVHLSKFCSGKAILKDGQPLIELKFINIGKGETFDIYETDKITANRSDLVFELFEPKPSHFSDTDKEAAPVPPLNEGEETYDMAIDHLEDQLTNAQQTITNQAERIKELEGLLRRASASIISESFRRDYNKLFDTKPDSLTQKDV